MQLAGIILKVHYPKMAVICGVEHTMLLFFNDFSNIPIVNQMISDNNMICNFLVLIPYLNQNLKIFTIETLVYLVEMTLKRLDISWGCTDTR